MQNVTQMWRKKNILPFASQSIRLWLKLWGKVLRKKFFFIFGDIPTVMQIVKETFIIYLCHINCDANVTQKLFYLLCHNRWGCDAKKCILCYAPFNVWCRKVFHRLHLTACDAMCDANVTQKLFYLLRHNRWGCGRCRSWSCSLRGRRRCQTISNRKVKILKKLKQTLISRYKLLIKCVCGGGSVGLCGCKWVGETERQRDRETKR
jgi:hypothetical protein